MNISTIARLQKDYGFWDIQQSINTGMAWKMEGSFGRSAMDMLRSGACMLPKVSHRDYYGNIVPSRDVLKPGTMGTYKNSVAYWSNLDNHEFIASIED